MIVKLIWFGLLSNLLLIYGCIEENSNNSDLQQAYSTEETVSFLEQNVPKGSAYLIFSNTNSSGSKLVAGISGKKKEINLVYNSKDHPKILEDCAYLGQELKGFLELIQRIQDNLNLAGSKKCRERLLTIAGKVLMEPFFNQVSSPNDLNHLVIIPDSPLTRIPIGAIRFNGEYLIENFKLSTVHYWPKEKLAWKKKQKSASSSKSVSIIGSHIFENYKKLPNALAEREQIEKLIPESQVIWDKDFKWSLIKEKSDSKESIATNLMHFITHGTIEDGRFYLIDSAGEKMDAFSLASILKKFQGLNFISFNSCESANSYETTNLSLASTVFAFSGIESIGTYWSVDDAAASMFGKAFYTYLSKSPDDPMDAIKKAKIDMIRSDKFSHPYYWSAYEYNGFGF